VGPLSGGFVWGGTLKLATRKFGTNEITARQKTDQEVFHHSLTWPHLQTAVAENVLHKTQSENGMRTALQLRPYISGS